MPLTREYFERMAGILGTGGRALKTLLEERAKDREREDRQALRRPLADVCRTTLVAGNKEFQAVVSGGRAARHAVQTSG